MELKVRPYELIERLKKSELNAHVTILSGEIAELEKAFTETDYKTIKNLQYERLGKELPYSWEEIDTVAESIRAQINEKETALNNLLKLIPSDSETPEE
jgi:hydrogenase maturation factor HypE